MQSTANKGITIRAFLTSLNGRNLSSHQWCHRVLHRRVRHHRCKTTEAVEKSWRYIIFHQNGITLAECKIGHCGLNERGTPRLRHYRVSPEHLTHNATQGPLFRGPINMASTLRRMDRQVLDPRRGCPCNVEGGPGSSTEYIKFESFRTLRERSWDAITGVMVVTSKKVVKFISLSGKFINL